MSRDPPGVAQSRTVYVDPHVHTLASYDAVLTPERLLKQAATAGLDAVVVTDHDTVQGASIVRRRASAFDVLAIPGCEVSTADGHLLGIGIDTAPEPGRSLAATATEIHDRGGISIIPHPFQRFRHGVRRRTIKQVDQIDGIEVYNAHTLTNIRNRQAESFATHNEYPAFAGSDAHRASGIGHAATAVELPRGDPITAETILAAMRAGRTAAVWRQTAAWEYLSKVVDSAKRKTLSLI